MTAPDYHPLSEGLILVYEARRAGGTERFRFECLEARRAGDVLVARVRRTWGEGPGRVSEERLELRPDGLWGESGLILPLPPRPDARWIRSPREYFIEGADARVETLAGAFAGCLSVGYLIAAGDAGSGRRLYAPGVGLVYEKCSDEADPYELILVSASDRRTA